MGSARTARLLASISPGQLTCFLDHVRLVGQGGRRKQVRDTDKTRIQRAVLEGRVGVNLVHYKGIKS